MLGLGQWVEQCNLTMLVFQVLPNIIYFLFLSRTFACQSMPVSIWRTKQVLTGELEGKFCIVTHARIWYVCKYIYFCRTLIFWESTCNILRIQRICSTWRFQENLHPSTE